MARRRTRPRLTRGLALERSREDISHGLRGHDGEHEIGETGEVAVSEAGVEPEDGGFDEA